MEKPSLPDGDDTEVQDALDAPKLLPIQTCQASQPTSSSASIEDEIYMEFQREQNWMTQNLIVKRTRTIVQLD